MMRAALYTILGGLLPGCSLILDFSDSAIPKDAAPPDVNPACAFDEPNDDAGDAASVTVADTGPAAICSQPGGAADLDFYRFEVPDLTTSVTVQLVYQPVVDGDLALAITDTTGAIIASESDSSTTKTIVCPGDTCGALATGTYEFEVSGLAPADTNEYTFALTIAM